MNAPLNIDVVQILLHMLNLVILVGGLSLILYKPVSDFLNKRKAYYEDIEEKRKAFETEKSELEETRRKMLEDAERQAEELRKNAERDVTALTKKYADEAKAKADAVIRAAEDEADARKKYILESAQTEIGELVLSAAQKLLSDTAGKDTDSALYDEFLTATGARRNERRYEFIFLRHSGGRERFIRRNRLRNAARSAADRRDQSVHAPQIRRRAR